jgi:flagellar assembly protein FliH
MMDGMASRFVGILYAEDFDDDPEPLPPADLPRAPEPAPPPPSFTLEDLEAAQRIARTEAVQAARTEWERSALHDRTQSLAAIASAVAGAQEEARTLADVVAEGLARTILSVLAGLLPELCARHGNTEVRALLRHLLPTLTQQPRIAVRVAPAMLNGVREDLALLDEDLAAAVELIAAPLTPGDARVTWTDGSLVRDQAAIRHAITSALTELGLLEPVAVVRTPQRSMAHAE